MSVVAEVENHFLLSISHTRGADKFGASVSRVGAESGRAQGGDMAEEREWGLQLLLEQHLGQIRPGNTVGGHPRRGKHGKEQDEYIG